MSEIFSAFGVDWRLLAVQATNFGLLLLVLWKFLYGPLIRMLDERRARVAQGVTDAQAAAEALRGMEAARAARLAIVGKEADSFLAHARETAAKKQKEASVAAAAAAASMLKDAEREAKEIKARVMEESRREAAKLIVLGIEKAFIKK
ncbi:hypothetical protein A2852_02595 [Candidatus Adlerbacteria bacterium RIFCSPHIGHO2_01_FULL_54_23]|uniref:ATP synthase subunit b n=2 Tax=Candidatus Adleribacteriota TaxID=1752736 RepID=A0A1F4Y157_9BACT|nr:MAG: ATP synthase subunit b [Candidatus Adlerbacteria bacterium GW2011_GWB1_54_7]OGC78614.1 MAG: hypothetical protein A2852_02595 [Candidatus Adlerbacteria bacterium RIFCSPHIGHO2_01_FULL_54_23]OGC87621.1 MAG: hypothetical protein A3B33_01790 [Candidatus Adlerbacteria bacterium RIFCSPLOWO2_01_FULL_54_16]